MRFAIDAGHGCGDDVGAVGWATEDRLNLEVVRALIPILRAAGHEVVAVRPTGCSDESDSLSRRVATANQAQADIYVSVHFNSFVSTRAFGTEVYYTSPAGRRIARPVQAELIKLGFFDRGVKSANFYVLRNTLMPAILVEVCFLSSPVDQSIYEMTGATKVARAIARGLDPTINLPPEPTPQLQLEVRQPTLLKPSVEQSSPEDGSINLSVGTYDIDENFYVFEERHHRVRLTDGQQGWVWQGHADIIEI